MLILELLLLEKAANRIGRVATGPTTVFAMTLMQTLLATETVAPTATAMGGGDYQAERLQQQWQQL